jgi:hypothetical protein
MQAGLLGLAMGGCASSDRGARPESASLDLSVLMKADSPESLKSAANELRLRAKHSKGALREINERMARFIEERLLPLSQSREATLKQRDLDELASIMREVSTVSRKTGDLKPRYELAANLLSLSDLAQSFELNGELYRQEALQISDELLKEDPDSAEAHLLAATLTPDESDRIALLVRCLELDPGQEGCRKELENLAARVSSPYCEGVQIRPQFGIYRCTQSRSKEHRKIFRESDQSFYCSPEPLLNASDIEQITASSAKLPGLLPSSEAVQLGLKAKAVAKVSQASREATDTSGGEFWIAALNGQILSAPKVQSPLDQAQIQLSLGSASDLSAEAWLHRLCRKVEHPELPEAIKRLLKGPSHRDS